MTIEQREKSIQTGELQIGNWGRINHFSVVILLCFFSSLLPLMHLWNYFQGDAAGFISDEIFFIVIPLVLAYLLYLLQKSRLKFKVMKTGLKWTQVLAAVESVAEE